MNSRINFREHGAGSVPRSQAVLWVVIALLAVLGLYGLGQQIDDQAAAEDARLLAAQEQGRLDVQDELASRIAAAYAQGQRDAMAALRERPEGLQLAQACAARGQ